MIDFLLWLTMTSYWTALFLGLVGLFGLRLSAAIVSHLPLKQTLFVVFVPLSIGYYLTFPDNRPFQRLYRFVSAIVFILTLLASFWIFYTHFA